LTHTSCKIEDEYVEKLHLNIWTKHIQQIGYNPIFKIKESKKEVYIY